MDEQLYRLQNHVLASLQGLNDGQFSKAKLCGGTALARCWLHHRYSYDLDFFLPLGFQAIPLSSSLKRGGIVLEVTGMTDDQYKANQLHGFIVHADERLQISFIEDSYFDVYPAVQAKLGDLIVNTEEVAGLYHRKLRTVSGHLGEGSEVVGGRQTARDLFDLYVLSQAYMPIRDFIATLPYAFPSDAFDNGLASIPWMSLTSELQELRCDPQWEAAKDISTLQEALYREIGATAVDELGEEGEGDNNDDTPGHTGRGSGLGGRR